MDLFGLKIKPTCFGNHEDQAQQCETVPVTASRDGRALVRSNPRIKVDKPLWLIHWTPVGHILLPTIRP